MSLTRREQRARNVRKLQRGPADASHLDVVLLLEARRRGSGCDAIQERFAQDGLGGGVERSEIGKGDERRAEVEETFA